MIPNWKSWISHSRRGLSQKHFKRTEHWFCARSNESSITRFQGSSWTDMASCCCGSYSMKVSSPSQRSQVCGSTSLPKLGTSWAWQAKKNNVSQTLYHPCVICLHFPYKSTVYNVYIYLHSCMILYIFYSVYIYIYLHVPYKNQPNVRE